MTNMNANASSHLFDLFHLEKRHRIVELNLKDDLQIANPHNYFQKQIDSSLYKKVKKLKLASHQFFLIYF